MEGYSLASDWFGYTSGAVVTGATPGGGYVGILVPSTVAAGVCERTATGIGVDVAGAVAVVARAVVVVVGTGVSAWVFSDVSAGDRTDDSDCCFFRIHLRTYPVGFSRVA